MKIGIIIVLITILVVRIGVDIIEAFQESPSPITFSETCTTTLTLASVPNGLAGFTVRVDVPVISGITTSEIIIDETSFPLQSITPPQSMDVKGMDLGASIQPGSSDVVLFSVSPCIDRAVILRLDDDNGFPIVPPGTEVFP